MKTKFSLMKVFDCQDMSKELKESFFRIFERKGHNDIIVNYTISNERFKYTASDGTEVDIEDSEWALDKKALDAWLIANGANAPITDDSEGEEVLIKHWW